VDTRLFLSVVARRPDHSGPVKHVEDSTYRRDEQPFAENEKAGRKTMSKRARKRRDRKKSAASHGKRPNT
jgi:hypothetical protein